MADEALAASTGRGDDAEPLNSVELQPKRTNSFSARRKKKRPVEHDLATRIAMEREKTKYWARVVLLFPLAPVCVALTTIVFGGVIVNVAANDCNSDLMTFMQGAVVLSYMLVWFYTYCWMGPWPIKSLRTVRVFYLLYGSLCVIWWGVYGTLQAATATSSGFESCLAMSPSLYLVSQYEVAIFWILFLTAIGFLVNEKTARLREDKMAQWSSRKAAAKRAQEQAEQEKRDQVLKEAQEKARELEEEQRQKVAAEQEQIYGSEGEQEQIYGSEAEQEGGQDGDDTMEYGGGGEEEAEAGEGEEEGEEEEEEEEVVLVQGGTGE